MRELRETTTATTIPLTLEVDPNSPEHTWVVGPNTYGLQ